MSAASRPRHPKHWPENIRFLQSPQYHTSVERSVLHFLQSNSSFNTNEDGLCGHTLYTIRPITKTLHPARGQRGLFASKKIPAKTYILDYLGEVHCDDRPESDYDISLYRFQDGVSVGVDAATMGNESRFINDYRGVRERPNAEFRDRRAGTGELRMSIWSTETIQRGEEVLVTYGKAWWAGELLAFQYSALY
jgi:hypothetical protein